VVARAPNGRLPERDTALLIAELKAPERAILPPFLLPAWGRTASTRSRSRA
jgi:hypothetical protein